ncbi:hypothetical protein ABIB57_004668 [Devosia sp. UYZn731]|uniref:GTPase-associated system all-helical protein GASH n=1 Tax=Devosia sp. UYZn731 TaxID=3156345 RepID=UPI003391CF32
MVDVAQHIRIFDQKPADELVPKRTAAIKDLASKLTGPKDVDGLMKMASNLVAAAKFDKKLPEELAQEATASIKKQSPAFVREGRDLELSTIALLAMLGAIDGGTKQGIIERLNFLSAGVWLGLSFQQPNKESRIEALRVEVLHAARDYVARGAENARERKAPALGAPLKPENTNLGEVVSNLRASVERLNRNAVVDREEIDFLWWSVTKWSSALDGLYDEASAYSAAIAFGLDGGARLRRMPLDVHKHLVLRRIRAAEPVSLAGLIAAVGDDRLRILTKIPDASTARTNPEIFPVMSSLLSGSAPKSASKDLQSVEAWTVRALLEATALGLINQHEV